MCHFKCYLVLHLVLVWEHMLRLTITIRTFWYANDVAVAEETSGAKISVFSFEKMENHFEIALS